MRRKLSEELSKPNIVSETLEWLAEGPTMQVLIYRAYSAGGYQLYTRERDMRSTVKNSRSNFGVLGNAFL